MLCIVSQAHADERLDVLDDEIPVVLSASRLIQPISSSPSSITIIDAEMIELSGARTIVDLLRLVPGFQVGRQVNGNPTATYHGTSERYNPRLQLIIDGRPTYVPLYGGIPWSELPVALSDIQRIEVTRAPNAATFGPNSFKAVVSITTRAPAENSGWFVNTEAGGNEFRSGTVSYYESGDKVDYRVTLQSERDEGFENISDNERSKLGSVRTHWQLTPTDRIGIDIGATQGGHMELSTIVEENDLARYEETLNAYTQFVWEHAHSSEDSWRVQYYFNYFDIKDSGSETFDAAAASDNPLLSGLTVDVDIDRDSRSTRHELEVQRSFRLNPQHRLVYGAAVRQDSVMGQFQFADEQTRYINAQRVFAHSEFAPREKWLLNSGLLIENNSITNISTSPRFSLAYQHAPGQQLRFGYSRGIRTPLLLEEDGLVEFDLVVSNGLGLTDQIVINDEQIEPETIDVIDFGYYYNNARRGFTLDAKISYHELRDLIALKLLREVETDTFDQTARAYRNRFNYQFTTFELQLDYKLSNRYRFRASYAYAFGEDSVLNSRNLIPKHTLSVLGSVRLNRQITASAEYYYSGNWIWDDVRDKSKLNRLDLRLAKNIRLSRLNASLALQAELDLGDTVDYLQRNQVENLYFARLTVQLP
ncbi:MAG: TonB-dependent receptor plug domain-containing protein [Granulosicoccus sp.]